MNPVAIKEWAVAVRAMEIGKQNVIFRKGGIQESGGEFELLHNDFLLYPAREHQARQYLKPEFLPLLEQIEHEQTGQQVIIRSKASVLRYHLINTVQEAAAFKDQHIWNEEFLQMRLDYKPDRALYVIELTVQPLASPLQFVETAEQMGCKSWVWV